VSLAARKRIFSRGEFSVTPVEQRAHARNASVVLTMRAKEKTPRGRARRFA
jgi:hypothetical protein